MSDFEGKGKNFSDVVDRTSSLPHEWMYLHRPAGKSWHLGDEEIGVHHIAPYTSLVRRGLHVQFERGQCKSYLGK